MTCISAHTHAILLKLLLSLMMLDKSKYKLKRKDGLNTTLYFQVKPHSLNESFERWCARNPLGKPGSDLQTTLDFPNAPLPALHYWHLLHILLLISGTNHIVADADHNVELVTLCKGMELNSKYKDPVTNNQMHSN